MVDRSGPQAVLGGYQLEEELGAGSTGAVWRARRKGPVRQVVAVKRLRVGAAGSEVDRLRREAEILASSTIPTCRRRRPPSWLRRRRLIPARRRLRPGPPRRPT